MSWLITGTQKVNWTPALITTALWLDAADSSTITESGGAVSQWNDKSGNGRDASQSTAANRPAYTTAGQNGRNVLTFDGSNDGLELASDLNIKNAHTLFVAAANTSTITSATSPQILLSGSGYTHPSTTTSDLLLGAGGITGTLTNERLSSLVVAHDIAVANVYSYGKTNSDITGGFFLSSSFTTTGNVFAGYLNGTLDFGTTSSAGGFSGTNTRYPSAVRGIGYRYSNSFNFWNGQIWEVIILQAVASTDTRQRIEGYLAHKWGLTTNLPNDHPYKVNAPVP